MSSMSSTFNTYNTNNFNNNRYNNRGKTQNQNANQSSRQYQNRTNKNVIDTTSRNNFQIRRKIPKNIESMQTRQQQQCTMPFNHLNKYLPKDFIEELLKKFDINYKIKNMKLFQEAFIHKSYLKENYNESEFNLDECNKEYKELEKTNLDYQIGKAKAFMLKNNLVPENYNFEDMIPLQDVCNEKLEMVGDAALGHVVTQYLYERYPEQDEGFWTRLKTKLVNGERLAEWSEKFGLNEYLILSKFLEDTNNGRKNTNFLEDQFEAFLGALFQDCKKDYKLIEKFIYGILENYVDFADIIENDKNYKDQLLRYYQQNYPSGPGEEPVFPHYKELSITKTINNVRIFQMGVLCPDKKKVVGIGEDKTKKQAEQEASRQALIYYGILE